MALHQPRESSRRGAAPRGRVCVQAVLALLILLGPAPARAAAETPVPWSWPLGGSPSVVRGFEPPPQPWLAGHRGVDLRASPGDPVRAAGPGTVTFAGRVGGLPVVTVSHADGLRTTYQPVLAALTRGQHVARGAVLGRLSAGGSHCLPLACLHWGLRRGSAYLDPLTLVGGDHRVRLLPIWPAAGTPTQITTLRGDLARLGALNRVRAAGWEEWFG